jgi:predicted DNA-binding protein
MFKPQRRRTIRLSPDLDDQLLALSKADGCRTPSAFLRAVILDRAKSQTNESEDRVVSSIDRLIVEVRRIVRTQPAQFAFLDGLAKVLLTWVAERSGEAIEPAVARARARYDRLLKSAGKSLSGDSASAMRQLIDRGENDAAN